MLRSAGYFRSFSCPFDARGCRRPHCQYRHEAGRSEELSPAPPRQPLRGFPALGLGRNIQELERINKAIQSVKTEVEEEEKKLLYYNLGQDELQRSLTSAKNIRENVFSDEGSLNKSPIKEKGHVNSISKVSSKSSKYILDHSCPSTDLEYDPLLNYTAGLLRSSLKEDENDRQYSKHMKMFPCGNLQRSTKTSQHESRYGSPRKRSRSSSPIKLEIKLQESDDDVLIIDAPPVNVSKKPRISRTCKKNREENQVSSGTKVETLKNVATSASLHCTEEKRQEDTTVAQDYINQSDGNKTERKSSANECFYLPYIKMNALNAGSKLDDDKKYHPPTKESISSASQMKIELNKEMFKEVLGKVVSIKTCNVEQQVINQCSEDSSKAILLQETSKKVPEHLGKQSLQTCEKGEVSNNTQSRPLPDLSENISHDAIFFPENIGEKQCDNLGYTNTKENCIIISDSSEKEDSEEDTEHSESDDTMEECRRIFNEFVEHEAQKEKMAKKQALAMQTEVASDVKVSTTKEIIVPFKAPLPQQTSHSRILQAQQQAVQITAAVKSGQAFVAATCAPKKSASVIPATHIQSMGPMVCLNMFEVQPVTTSSGQLNVLVPGNALTAVPCKLSSNPVKRIAPMPIKVSSRRRPSVVPELGSKVPLDIRQRYVNFFVEELLKVCATVNEAFDKALIEEKAIYNRCGSKNMYLNIAVNSLKKLRDHANISNGQPYGNKGTTSSGLRKQQKDDFTGITLYRLLKDYALTEEQLKENGYPESNPEKPGSAMLCSSTVKPAVSDPSRRVCCRCGEIYTVTSSGNHVRKEECNYHSGRVLRHKVPGGLETRYSCCEGIVGSPGCQVAKFHVHDGRNENRDGFVMTFIKPPPLDGNYGVFALDCEMCYTARGLELSRVAIVDPSLQVIYDTFVKPANEILDYNTRDGEDHISIRTAFHSPRAATEKARLCVVTRRTGSNWRRTSTDDLNGRFSGVTAEDMKNVVTSIRDVQAVLLNLFSADTILIGHSLENDLFALKLFHNKIVDTSVVFPHRLGAPHKRALRNLMADYLRRIIQDDVSGHDCTEDASACMELMLWKVKEDTKGRR
ncbi:RNA exonuclease 1 homolog isoform X3 [Hemicordylus capensis]|uniref:RNA exonuclease 1 homolog isoform X3 n=1 Tax=Hemicordylus capensis TaxID=884348 RepID=UPI002302E937|nr:RNA exonuclease 1 homolog isoform X3 [Hemicordylus capensis]